tara:strand:+ start:1650 stop:2108 length:459 start_codon:yes stop_codon:yes gene_type:complete
MSFKNKTTVDAAMIEYTKTSTQTVSDGDTITFQTKRTTGSDGVSINGSGVISLDSNRSYWIQASIAINMSSNGDYKVTFQDSSGNTLSESDGVFPAYQSLYPDDDGQPFTNSSYMASLIVERPSLSYRLVVVDVPTNSTVRTETNLLIKEVS